MGALRKARAFCPGHISTFFAPRGNPEEPDTRGSVGSGFSLRSGVTTAIEVSPPGARREQASPFSLAVLDNGRAPASTEISFQVLVHLGSLAGWPGRWPRHIAIQNAYALPLGAGFGVSGGLALALALAANEALEFGLPRSTCVRAAHWAEAAAGTGLGDVSAQSVGGFEVRTKETPPPRGKVMKLPTREDDVVVASFGPRPTREFLQNPAGMDKLAEVGERCLSKLRRSPSLRASTRLGRAFAEELGLVSPRAAEVMRAVGPKVPSSVAMLGDSVFFLGGDAVEAKVRAAAGNAFVLRTRIDPRGARVLKAS